MLSVECNKSEIEAVVEAVNKSRLRVDVACYNGPRSFVLAGDAPSIESAKDECRPFKTTGLQNTHAYHSYLADGILQDLAKVAGSITIRPPRLRVETCSANGSWPRFTAEEVVQLTRRPVYFGDAVERIAARLPSAIWLEAGSTTPVIAMARRVINKPDRSDVFIPMELGIADAPSNLAKATCQLWKARSAAQYWLFHSGPSVRRHYQLVNLPPYQFDKPSHWIQLKIPTRSEQPKEVGLVTIMSNTASGELLFSVDTANAVFELAGRGHAVTGQSLCPASMYMELAILAARSAVNTATTHATEILPHVEGLVMLAPLGLGAGISVFLRLRQTAQDSWDFTLFSRSTVSGPVEDGGTEHARGRISWGSADDTMADRGVKLLYRFGAQGIKRLSSLAATGISGAMVYKLFSEVVAYADYYRGVQSVSASGNEAIGLVTVPAQFSKASAGICDPIILDNFLQVAGIHVNCLSQRDDDQVFMCTAVEEVIFTAHFMTSRGDSRAWSVYTRYEASSKAEIANDIFVCDASSGKLVLAVLGATFRSVPFKSLARSLTRLNKVSTIVPTSLSAPIHDRDGDDVLEDSAYQTGSSSSPGGDGETNFKKHVELYLDPAPLFQPLVGQPTKKSSGSSNVLQQIRNLFSAILEIPVEEIQPTSTLDDLGVDSLLVTEILSEVQSRFKATISQSEFLGCTDVFSVARLIEPDQPVESTKKPSEPSLNGVASPDKLTNGMSHASSDKTGNKAGPNLAIVSRECFVAAKASYDSHGRTTGFSGFYSEAFPLQSELVVRYVVEAFATLGCNLQAMQPGDEVPIIPFEPRHKKLIPQLYRLLEDGGLVTKETDGAFCRTKTPVPTVPAVTLHQDMLAKFPKHASETKLLHTTGHRLADCISGAADPIALIFQNSAARALLEDVYTNAPMFKTGTLLLGQYLSSVLERLGGRRELKILELGAGTGGTSKYIIETLAALRYKFSYTFTDLSSSLVAAAKRKFAKWPFMQYTTMDIEKEPAAEFLGNYDVVLSTNCIHATKDLVVSTTNIRKMLRPDGILCLVELTRNLYWFDLVFGLLEGWWLFNDGREHALAHEGRWDQSLHTAGFDWVDWSTSPSPESDILRVVTASQYKLEPTNVDSGLGQANKTETDNHLSTKQTVAFKEVDGLQLQADIYYPPAVVDPSKRLPIGMRVTSLA
jgi:SAM-dependent methyltransferase/acyl carrier protein